MIPPFMENGYLEPGIHLASQAEFEKRFVYGNRRKEIYEGLKRLFADLRAIGCNCVYIDGSYVSEKNRPGDADVCWDLIDDPMFYTHARLNCPILFKMDPPRAEQQAKYSSDVFPANVVETNSGLRFLNYLQQIKFSTEKKGIIKIELI